MQTLEYMANQNNLDDIIYDKTLGRNVFIHIEIVRSREASMQHGATKLEF